jgi:uncharacterized RDD family membrane protein YckC
MSTRAIVTTDYAGLVTRALAFAVDAIAISVVGLGVGAIAGLAISLFNIPHSVTKVLVVIGGFAFLIWTIAYFVTFWSTTGQTPGDRLMRIQVIAADGSPQVRVRRAIVRFAGMMLAAIPLFAGFFLVLVDDRRRGLHDMLARTIVVYTPDEPAPVSETRRSAVAVIGEISD